MLSRVRSSDALVRIVPLGVFAVLTVLQDRLGGEAQYWIYAAKTMAAASLLWLMRRRIPEMGWRISLEAMGVGIVVFLAWIGLDGHYPMLFHRPASFNPAHTFGAGSTSALLFLGVRLAGATLVVPAMEEVFYRSFLYRFFLKSDFQRVSLGDFEWRAFLLSGLCFGIGHYEWLPGILCGFAYQGLVCRKNRLGDAISAHAITNALLGVWVVGTNSYYFW
jgi:uncharacterized protein